tara:strand:- start:500 stop:739 length:240 start_codon:yes stop_codon:yes gene_type:complete
MKRMSKIMVFEPTDSTLGPEVTLETETSRKSFRLPRSAKANEQAPLAIESFAQDPERYAELMERIEQYLLDFKDESSQE